MSQVPGGGSPGAKLERAVIEPRGLKVHFAFSVQGFQLGSALIDAVNASYGLQKISNF